MKLCATLLRNSLLLVIALLATHSPVLAQIATPGGDGGGNGNNSAAAGTMVAAAMETVGYHAQAEILANLSGLIQTAGALIFLGVAFSAVLTVAMLGNYRSALWMLVGPALFYFASGIEAPGITPVRDQADGAEWRFGAFRDTENYRDRFINPGNTEASVSYVFHRLNVLVSEASQKLIEVFTNKDIEHQMIFMARQRTLEELFGSQITDAGADALIGYFLVTCSTEVGDARLMARMHNEVKADIRTADEVQADPDYLAAKERYCRRFPIADKHFVSGPWMDMVYTLPDKLPPQFVPRETYFATHQKHDVQVSCKDLWQWSIRATQYEGAREIKDIIFRVFPANHWARGGVERLLKVLSEVNLKVERDEQETGGKNIADPCPFDAGSAAAIGVDDYQMQNFINKISAKLLRNSMVSPPNQLIFNRVIHGHHGIVAQEGAGATLSTNPNSRRSQLERQRATQFAEAQRYEAYALIHLLPYLQGFLLYALAVLYPFFTLLILVPGQAGQFFTWVALWTWAKSWDVGWALVMIADGIIWELLPKTTYFNPETENNNARTPLNLLEGAFGGDPSYSISMYWLLLSTMVVGVPLISAYAILGTKRAIAGRLLTGMNGLKGWAEGYGDSAMRYSAGKQVGAYGQISSQASAANQVARGTDQALKKMMNANSKTQGQDGKGLVGESVSKAKADASSKAQHILTGPFQGSSAMIGQEKTEGAIDSAGSAIGSPNMGSELGSENNGAGPSALGRSQTVESSLQSGAAGDRIDESKEHTQQYGAGMVAPATRSLADFDPTGTIRQALFGPGTSEQIQAMQGADFYKMVMRHHGVDTDYYEQFANDPDANRQINELFRLQLARRTIGGLQSTNAELMAIASTYAIPFWGAAGGPAGMYQGVRTNAGIIQQQRDAGFSIIRDQNDLTAQLQINLFSWYAYESHYDPRFVSASEGAAYVSGDRGGEFFVVRQYSPDFNFHLERARERSDMRWNFETGRAMGNTQRWNYQILDPILRKGD